MLLAWATWDYVGKCCYLAQKEASKRFCLQHYTTGVMAGKKQQKHWKTLPFERGDSVINTWAAFREQIQWETDLIGCPGGNGACLCIHEVVNINSEPVLKPFYVSSLCCFLQVWCTTGALVLHLLLIRISWIQFFCKFWILLGLLS